MADVDDRWFRPARDPRTGRVIRDDNGKPVPEKTARWGLGKRYRARWRDEAGRQRARSFDRKIDADAYVKAVQTDLARGQFIDPAAGRRQFRVYAEQWRESQVHRPSTRAHIETHFRRHVYPVLGDRRIGTIRPSEIQAWVRGLEVTGEGRSALAPATIRVIYRYVAAVLAAAVKDRLIPVSPCVDVKLPKVAPKRVQPPTTEQVAALMAAVLPRYRALILVGMAAGLRQGEAFAVEVRHVDFLRRSLHVDQQLSLMPGAGPVIAPPKTQSSVRSIPLPQSVVDALAAHLAVFPAVPLEIDDTTGARRARRAARLVFTDNQAQALRRTSFSARVWRPAREAANLPAEFTYHSLRHYFASALIRHGESVLVVQARLGHKSARETTDTYGHLWPDAADRTREAVEAALPADVAHMWTGEAVR